MTELDLELIFLNLELDPTERLCKHQMALDLIWEIDQSKVGDLNEKPQQPSLLF